MVSAGIDTVPANLVMCIAYLASEAGQRIQKKALESIHDVYANGEAWERCLGEEKVPYITALVKETLRFWTVIPICLPRESIRAIPYGDAVIPAGTTFFMVSGIFSFFSFFLFFFLFFLFFFLFLFFFTVLSWYPPPSVILSLLIPDSARRRLFQNAWAADYDADHFKDPYTFLPERYLGNSEAGTPHYGYGAGSRMCLGSHLGNRELYTALIRLITGFEMVQAQDAADRPLLDALACNAMPTALTTMPKPFKVGFKPRNEQALRSWIAASRERTRDL